MDHGGCILSCGVDVIVEELVCEPGKLNKDLAASMSQGIIILDHCICLFCFPEYGEYALPFTPIT